MSGGVDSSVAASLYRHYPKVQGIYMANWQKDAKCNEEEWKVVQSVAKQLEIPVERVSFEKEYWLKVFEPMINSYSEGFTPNPDINCNKFIKFGELIEYLNTKYQDYWLVTGHYSRIMQVNEGPHKGRFDLLRGKYSRKDQSYYLSSINNNVLSKILLPIGHYTKPEVREIAKKLNLVNKDKPDSMGLCFVQQDEKKFDKFLDEFIEPNPGNIVTEDGKIWGQHQGLWYATIGQRCKISMPQGDPKYQGTWFISDKNFETNELIIVKGSKNPKLYKNGLIVRDFECKVNLEDEKIEELTLQYRSLMKPVEIKHLSQTKGKLIIEVGEKQRAMAPGQNIVIYNGDRIIGCGILEESVDLKAS
ncbi:mitochondrial tRNA-specific 2-thiouridylase 1 [[Candida] jaroonii]|uniref:Mitochondrial tRNA-specific 2-thiouridylase 1 n=1 Tax=[Candida] jaroonii TaxID=467808 RepID=A0ACA9Y5H5_9ASCO|nr:mitochondrial tRNA-specific 2-thiouridylase 1 [[Candida] jaroonii]